VTINSRGRHTLAGTPVPKKEYEDSKLDVKPIISVDFRTGEKYGNLDEYYRKQKIIKGEDSMPQPINVLKVDFIRAVKKHKTVREAAQALGISIGSFYKCKEKWAADLAKLGIDTETDQAPTEIQGNETVQEIEAVDPEPWPKHDGADPENPPEDAREAEPVKDNCITVLEAVDMLEDLRFQSESVAAVFSSMSNQPWHPNIRKLLRDRQAEVDEKIQQIENKLQSITVAI